MYLCVLKDNNILIAKFCGFTEFALLSSEFIAHVSKLHSDILNDFSGYSKYINECKDSICQTVKESGSIRISHISVKNDAYAFIYKHRSVSFDSYCRKSFVLCLNKRLDDDICTEISQNLLATRYCSSKEILEAYVISNSIDINPYYEYKNRDKRNNDLEAEVNQIAEEVSNRFGFKIIIGISYDV